jgi:hypothetical protein
MGATAAQAVLGKDFRVTQHRGEFIAADMPYAHEITATVHPSSILSAPDAETRHPEMAQFIGQPAGPHPIDDLPRVLINRTELFQCTGADQVSAPGGKAIPALRLVETQAAIRAAPLLHWQSAAAGIGNRRRSRGSASPVRTSVHRPSEPRDCGA